MNLDFSEEQQMITDMARAMFEEHSDMDAVRKLEDDPKGYSDGLWKQMAESGLLGLTIPAEHGGGGQSLLEAALVYEELGRALASVPHFVSAIMSGGMLTEAGNDAQKGAWLPKIATGEAILTPAWLEPDRGYGPVGVQLAAKADGDGFVLNGTKQHVYFASSADRLIVLARTDAGIDLFLVDPKAGGVEMRQILSQSADAQYRVTFSNVKVSADDRISAAGSGWATFETAMYDGIVLLAAQAVGGANKALDITADYCKIRTQFDKPLGAFQALAHYLADASTRIDGGRVLVHEAAWSRANGRSIRRLAPMAKLFCCETYADATRMCEQLWGGVGFTLEYDVQLYFRRSKQLQLSWWDTPYLEELVAVDVLDS
ncbi:MAG: acyl-CoA/acyl-ACP dehydrogenase [Candidatus Binatia bacterium]|nr:acyl-CoA/acyl-ACP dehydrogenase [Candidatus Binatia bacterium]